MSFGYTELTMSLDSSETLLFDIKEDDGSSSTLNYTSGVCSITNIDEETTKQIGTVAIQPAGIIGRVSVTIPYTDMDSSTFFSFVDGEDIYGTPPLRYALSIKLDNEVKIRAKVRIVKVG